MTALRIYTCHSGARTIHLVMDNLNTHSQKALTETCGADQGGWLWHRLTPQYSPVHGSWLNQTEIEVSLFCRQCLGKREWPPSHTVLGGARLEPPRQSGALGH